MKWLRPRPTVESIEVQPTTVSETSEGCAWTTTREREPSILPREDYCRTDKGLEVHAFDNGDWRLFTQINGVHIMASGRTSSFGSGYGAEKLNAAKKAATRAAEILTAAGALRGF